MSLKIFEYKERNVIPIITLNLLTRRYFLRTQLSKFYEFYLETYLLLDQS